MAYRNVDVNIGGFQTANIVAANNVNYNYGNYTGTTIFTTGTNLLDLPITENEPYTLFDNGTFKMTAQYANMTNQEFYIVAYYNNEIIMSTGNWGYYLNTYVGIGFGVDDDTQLGAIFLVVTYPREFDRYYAVSQTSLTTAMREKKYLAITSTETPPYNWQSVPSISGKNGILSLVTLDSESINDGEPVSGAAVSVFDQAPSNDNNIKNLADTYGGGEESSAVDVTVKYKVTLPPGGSFSTLKIVAKKDSIPEDASDGDKIVDISPSKTKKTVTGLDENSLYYFKIFGEDTNSNTSESDEKHITTSGDEGWVFDYTGSIQTFTAPKTGIYQLETWGAQGGDATDGTNSARGGYGAYAVGEVLLAQGDTLYINVGGQDGYGGGGNYMPPIPTTGWIAKAVATENGFVDDVTGRNAIISDGSMGNYSWNATTQRITCGTDGLCTFDFGIDYPQSFLKTSSAIEFTFYGAKDGSPVGSQTSWNLSIRFTKVGFEEFISNVFSDGSQQGRAIKCSDSSAVGSRFDPGCVIVDDGRWDGKIIVYRFYLNNGTVTKIGQYYKNSENDNLNNIRETDFNFPLTINENDTFKIEFSTIDHVAIQYYGVKIYNE